MPLRRHGLDRVKNPIKITLDIQAIGKILANKLAQDHGLGGKWNVSFLVKDDKLIEAVVTISESIP